MSPLDRDHDNEAVQQEEEDNDNNDDDGGVTNAIGKVTRYGPSPLSMS